MPDSSPPTDPTRSRRRFLFELGAGAVGISLFPLAACDSASVTPLRTERPIDFLTPVSADDPARSFFVKNGADGALNNWRRPSAIAPDSWRLSLTGLFASPTTVTFADVQAAPSQTVVKTVRCIVDGNDFPGLQGTAVWVGTPLRPFLQSAGLDLSQTKRLIFKGRDGFEGNLTLDRLTAPPGGFEPLLAYQMEGAPLTIDHGQPVRLLVSDGYGYVNVKWLAEIEATARDEAIGTYQEVFGYVDDGVVRVSSKIAEPVFAERIPAGDVRIEGIALSGSAAVATVEVSIDNRPFEPADLVPLEAHIAEHPALADAARVQSGQPYPFPGVWAVWRYTWFDAPVGAHTIRVRATDTEGNTQPDRDLSGDDGFTATPEIQVEVV